MSPLPASSLLAPPHDPVNVRKGDLRRLNGQWWVCVDELDGTFAPTGDWQETPPSPDSIDLTITIWCDCGDGYLANTFEGGFLVGRGRCKGCATQIEWSMEKSQERLLNLINDLYLLSNPAKHHVIETAIKNELTRAFAEGSTNANRQSK